jgi:quinol---cytochrome c reductase iron-sulfur subunit, bacillus type
MSAEGTTRRGFLSLLTNTVLTVLGICVAAPAIAYVWSPLRKKSGDESSTDGFSDAGPLADLPVGKWQLVSIDVVRQDGWEKTRTRRVVYVRRAEEGKQDIAVLSPTCPHLGCSVSWEPDSDHFSCPCHKGVFNAQGELVGGPPPRGMDNLPAETRGDRLWVRWQDYKIGISERVPVEV